MKPITTEGATHFDVYFADNELYYNYFDYTVYFKTGFRIVDAPLNKIPVFARGGRVIPRRDRPRRSSLLMQWDPITLVVVLRKDGNAKGSLYPNDGETFDYESGAQIFTSLIFDQLSSALMLRELATAGSVTEAHQNEMSKVRVEKVIVIGAPV